MLQTTTNINVDFYDKKYILINAKQLDRKSRYLSFTCYNRGELISFNVDEHSAYIRYRKADNNSVFNFCEIDQKGKIKAELTEQMLAADGVCCADLVIVNKGGAKINSQTGEIVGIANSSILSTMPLHIDVTETATENSDIESSYEFNGFNTALEKAEAEYTEVMKTSKSWAVGGTGIRDGEDANNSKYWSKQSEYWSEQSKKSAKDSSDSASRASTSETNASISETNAAISETNAATSETNARRSMNEALNHAKNAKEYKYAVEDYRDETIANAEAASDSAKNAKLSEENANTSETNASNSADRAQSYAVGGTGTRDGEDMDNSYYYYERVKGIVNGLDSGFIPMGTISFSELSTVEKLTGYVYNIRDDFVTTDDFHEGAGKFYTAGTNIYVCSDGMLDCFGGASSPTATVGEIKDYLGI